MKHTPPRSGCGEEDSYHDFTSNRLRESRIVSMVVTQLFSWLFIFDKISYIGALSTTINIYYSERAEPVNMTLRCVVVYNTMSTREARAHVRPYDVHNNTTCTIIITIIMIRIHYPRRSKFVFIIYYRDALFWIRLSRRAVCAVRNHSDGDVYTYRYSRIDYNNNILLFIIIITITSVVAVGVRRRAVWPSAWDWMLPFLVYVVTVELRGGSARLRVHMNKIYQRGYVHTLLGGTSETFA